MPLDCSSYNSYEFYTSSTTYMCMGHADRREDHWLCDDCKHWFNNSVAHGHTSKYFKDKEKEKFPNKEMMFLIDRRNQEVQRAWRKDQYAKVKGQFRL